MTIGVYNNGYDWPLFYRCNLTTFAAPCYCHILGKDRSAFHMIPDSDLDVE